MGSRVLKIAGFTFLLLLCHLASLPGVDTLDCDPAWPRTEMEGLQGLWAEWNKSTPNIESNLLNWKSGNCKKNNTFCPCSNPAANWRGITCLRFRGNTMRETSNCETRWDTWVVGLELNDASIVGTLPSAAIRNISTSLVTLSLTGNPQLTGRIPGEELAGRPLNMLDLHNNGFNGTIPTELSTVTNLVKLDLSGNQLTGGFPIQLMNMTTLQDFRIARNKLSGTIDRNAFQALVQLFIVDVSGNNFTGPPPTFSTLTMLNHLNLSYNSFTELPALSEIFNTWLPTKNHSLRVLDLSGLNIGGRLLDWNSSPDLLSVEQLYLNNNSLTGELNITSMQSADLASILQVLSLKHNNINDVVFDKTSLFRDVQHLTIYLQGNPYCNDTSKDLDGRRCFCEQYCAVSPENSAQSYAKKIAITASISGFVSFLIMVILLKRKDRDMYALIKKLEESEVSAKRFEYNVLRTATKKFAEERKLGEGAYGAVYRGTLPLGVEIAVKQLFMKTKQAMEDFIQEILLISNLQHRNLVALKGYSLHGKEMLLVYDYVDHCDLSKLLFDGSSDGKHTWEVVSWPDRKKICLGVAQGLYYLHASSQTKIIHRDIKPSNILLDMNLNPKIADFGLARPMQGGKSVTMTGPAGTFGYLAPEYGQHGELSEKADVYSFGVLLLEIVSRRRKTDISNPEDVIHLPTLACKLHEEGRIMEVMDPKLVVNEVEAIEVRRVLETAVMCVQLLPVKRPTMFRAVAMLAGDSDLESDPCDNAPMFPRPECNLFSYSDSERSGSRWSPLAHVVISCTE